MICANITFFTTVYTVLTHRQNLTLVVRWFAVRFVIFPGPDIQKSSTRNVFYNIVNTVWESWNRLKIQKLVSLYIAEIRLFKRRIAVWQFGEQRLFVYGRKEIFKRNEMYVNGRPSSIHRRKRFRWVRWLKHLDIETVSRRYFVSFWTMSTPRHYPTRENADWPNTVERIRLSDRGGMRMIKKKKNA